MIHSGFLGISLIAKSRPAPVWISLCHVICHVSWCSSPSAFKQISRTWWGGRMISLNPKHILLLLLHLLRCMHLSNLSSDSLVRERHVQCRDPSKLCRNPKTCSQRPKLPHWKSISETNHLSPLTRPKLRLVPQGTDTQRLANISAHMLGHYGSSSPGNEVWPTCLNSSVFFLQNHHNLRDRLWRLKFCNTVPDGIWEGRWNNKCMIDTMMRLIPHPVHLNLSQVLHATITNMPSVTIRGDKGFSGWLCHTKSGKLQFHRKDPKSAYCTVVWKKARGFHSSFALRIGPCFLLIEF